MKALIKVGLILCILTIILAPFAYGFVNLLPGSQLEVIPEQGRLGNFLSLDQEPVPAIPPTAYVAIENSTGVKNLRLWQNKLALAGKTIDINYDRLIKDVFQLYGGAINDNILFEPSIVVLYNALIQQDIKVGLNLITRDNVGGFTKFFQSQGNTPLVINFEFKHAVDFGSDSGFVTVTKVFEDDKINYSINKPERNTEEDKEYKRENQWARSSNGYMRSWEGPINTSDGYVLYLK